MKARILMPLPVIVCLILLTPAVHPQTVDQKTKPRPVHLYQVNAVDEKSGGKRIGFIDNTGKLVIGFDRLPRTTIAVGEFKEGRAVIYLKKEGDDKPQSYMDAKVGYIDEKGEIIIAARFDSAYDFSEGLAYVQAEGFKGYINVHGELVIKLEDNIGPKLDWYAVGFHEGMAAALINQEVGFIDRSGKPVIKGYNSAARFSEGLAAVVVGQGRLAKYGFVNKAGDVVISPRFEPLLWHHNQIEYLSRFSEGLACVKVGDLYGYINKKGDFAIPPQFIRAADFSEGLASVMVREGMGYIDKSGRWVIAPRVAPFMGGSFKEGLAPAAFATKQGAKWGYIDHTGRVVIKPSFDEAHEFVGGVAAVYEIRLPNSVQESRWGYIDKTGKYLWEPRSGPARNGATPSSP
jgi:hypothetical protein